jgi:integrase
LPPRSARVTQFITLQHARELARTAFVKVVDGCDPAREKRIAKAPALVHGDVIEKAVAEFVERYAKPNQKPSSAYETERVLIKEVVGRWKGRRLSEIGKSDVLAMLDSIVDRGSPILANRCLAAFRKMCGWAVERGMLDASPCGGIMAPAPETSRDRVLSDSELAAAWRATKAAGWPFGAVTQLLILTGQRRSEVAGMTWREIDLIGKTWNIPKERTKNGVAHSVPLPDSAIAVLRNLPRVESRTGLIFTTNGAVPVSGFALAKKRLDALLPPDMEGWTLHDLRRTFATGLARLEIPVHVTEAVLNHRSGTIKGVAAVYNRYSYDAERRAAMNAWGKHVEALLSDGQGS